MEEESSSGSAQDKGSLNFSQYGSKGESFISMSSSAPDKHFSFLSSSSLFLFSFSSLSIFSSFTLFLSSLSFFFPFLSSLSLLYV